MSTKEVKRWSSAEIWKLFGESFDYPTEYISASDHDRIVAELRAELTEAKAEVERQRDAYEATLENHVSMQMTIAELRAEVERLNAAFESKCLYLNEATNIFLDNTETIARQKRVIEIATRTMATVLELEHCGRTSCPRPTRAMCSNESHKVLRSALKEIAAIEKEGGEG